jgi:hypothetical protein
MPFIHAAIDAFARALRLLTAIVAACFAAALGVTVFEFLSNVAYGNGHPFESLTGIRNVALIGFWAPFAALVALVAIVPLNLLFRRREGFWRSLAGRATHVAAVALAGALATFTLASFGGPSTEIPTWDETMSAFAQSLPGLLALSVPVGLAFNYAMTSPARPFSLGRTVFLPIWCVAFYAIPGYLMSLHLGTHWAYDPVHTRDAVVGGWWHLGETLFVFLAGVGALVAGRLPRLSTTLFGAALSTPLAFALWYAATPLGPESPTFTFAGSTFAIDWRRQPRLEKGTFNFEAKGDGPYAFAGRGMPNHSLAVSEDIASIDALTANYTWVDDPAPRDGLSCRRGHYSGRPREVDDVCVGQGEDGKTTTVVLCPPGFCFAAFIAGHLQYQLHFEREDFPKWREIEAASVDLFASVERGGLVR